MSEYAISERATAFFIVLVLCLTALGIACVIADCSYRINAVRFENGYEQQLIPSTAATIWVKADSTR